jgi:Class III cytochrome C family
VTSRARLLAVVSLLAVAFGCGSQAQEQAPAATPTGSPVAGMMATASPAMPSSPEAAVTMAPQPEGTAAAVSPATRPPAAAGRAATASPAPSATTQAAAPPATAPPAAATAAPSAATQPPATQPAATQPPAPARPAAQRPKGKVTLPAKLGAVTFDHEDHAGKRKIACTTCHHASKPQKPQVSENQRCRDCHTMPAAPPMKTSLQAAFHDSKGGTGTCIDCHKKSVASGTPAPVKCLECHKKK